jgi:ABC-2 type transport system permease protein
MMLKEFLDHRWKLIGGLLLGLATVVIGLAVPQIYRDTADPGLRRAIAEMTRNYPTYVWGIAFNPLNGLGLISLLLAALIGASLIASEVSRGTIFVLLSRPQPRDQILLTKYGVGAAILLGVILTVSLTLLALAALFGHPQHLGGTLFSALLLWLAGLFVLGLATLFSVVLGDVLRSLALTLTVIVLLAVLPALLQLPAVWQIPGYWTSFSAFQGHEFSVRQPLVSAVLAVLPLLVALQMFRRQQY